MTSEAAVVNVTRDRGEVERVEALHRREARRPDAALDHAPLTVDQFQFNQPQQVARVVQAALGVSGR
ncbi:hypothetical protein ADL19_30105 [Streptomyces purpurogeneiscleroticus]|nr:hypothetical protein ADL19_30105 [Streptomyces purpurogeneiscleroticus]